MIPRRKQDWPALMDRFMAEAAARPFAYGEWDCCLFALSHVDAITGSELSARFAGQCDDAASAREFLETLGGLERAVTDLFGPPLAAIRKAQRGDIVLYGTAEGYALGVVGMAGAHFHVLAADYPGIAELRIVRAMLGWRV